MQEFLALASLTGSPGRVAAWLAIARAVLWLWLHFGVYGELVRKTGLSRDGWRRVEPLVGFPTARAPRPWQHSSTRLPKTPAIMRGSGGLHQASARDHPLPPPPRIDSAVLWPTQHSSITIGSGTCYLTDC